jgi:predicted outer membrane repeat protein
MENVSSSPTLDNVTFSANSATYGGGISNTTSGGGVDLMSNPTLNNVTFSGNSANLGGGMHNLYSNPVLNNVTFSGNSAITSGGGMYNDEVDIGYPTLNNVILWGDTAGEDPEIHNPPHLITTIITDSVVEGGCPTGSNCTNIITDDPMLGPLAYNGGFTQTHALLPGSSAIDAGGVNSSCEATDQRGVSRPQGTACDIGAYEFLLPLFADGFECGSCAEWSSVVGEVP